MRNDLKIKNKLFTPTTNLNAKNRNKTFLLKKNNFSNGLTNLETEIYPNNFEDIDSLIEHYAINIYLATYDWPNHNFGMWKNNGNKIKGNIYSEGKWRFMTYD